jgi:hypothetical protein
MKGSLSKRSDNLYSSKFLKTLPRFTALYRLVKSNRDVRNKNKRTILQQKFDAERGAHFLPRVFSLEKNPLNPEIRDNTHGHQ